MRLREDAPAPTYTFVLRSSSGEDLVRIRPTGEVEFGPTYSKEKAARDLWESLKMYFPGGTESGATIRERLNEMLKKMEDWKPEGPDPIGPLHGAGMAFAYAETAKWFRTELNLPRT